MKTLTIEESARNIGDIVSFNYRKLLLTGKIEMINGVIEASGKFSVSRYYVAINPVPGKKLPAGIWLHNCEVQ